MSQTSPLDPTQSTSAAGVAGVPRPAANQSREQLRALAAQFESMLMTQMMRSMRSSTFDDGKDTGFSDGPLSDALYSELSLALSRAGGFGLGDAVLGPLARQAHQTSPAAVPLAAQMKSAASSSAAAVQLAAALAPAGAPASVMEEASAAVPRLPLGPASLTPLEPPAPRPFEARISSAFGWRKDPIDGAAKFHKGLDIAMPVGTEVSAARDGEVAFAGDVPGYGLTVLVNHAGRIATRYAHLSEINVVPGQIVTEGQVIARSGATGRVTGPHLHFEVLESGQPIDPDGLVGQSFKQ